MNHKTQTNLLSEITCLMSQAPPHPARREALLPRAALSPQGVWVTTSESTWWRRAAARSTGSLPVAKHGQDGRATVSTQTPRGEGVPAFRDR